MAWYYQTSPHDTHDWDSAQTPVLVDGEFNGKPRKLVLTASRNGYYFTLDRMTGEHLVTEQVLRHGELGEAELNAKGQPVRDPTKDYRRRRRAGVAGERRRHQLAAAGVQPGHRTVLRADRRDRTRCTT